MHSHTGTHFHPRPTFSWPLPRRTFTLGKRTLIMAVLNVTPDSFSDGGLFLDRDQAIDRALQLIDEGADILDVGGESTRPGNRPAESAATEQQRVLPVIDAVHRARPNACLSIDTYKAETASLAINHGAEIVNDISGFTWDPGLAATCAQLHCGVVLMHTRGKSADWHTLPPLAPHDVLPLVLDGLKSSLKSALEANIAKEKILLDPGFGFGKSFDENYPLLAHLSELQQLGRPILAGTSRKSFLGHTLAPLNNNSAPDANHRLNATIASTTAAILAGAHIVRVHDLQPAREAAAIADAILNHS